MARRGWLILIVDDDRDIARFIEMIMRRCGFAVASASDGQEGLDQTVALRPDLVITKVNMPRVDGFTLTERIRRDPGVASIPVLILTDKVWAEDKLRGLVAGADDYMVKPFDPHDLAAHVRALLERVRRPGYSRPLEGNASATVADALEHLDGLTPEARHRDT